MADKIIHLRSLTPSSVPTTSSLGVGQFAINVPDGRVFLRKSGSSEDVIISAITTNAQNTGSVFISGSLTVSGSTSLYADNGQTVLSTNADSIELTGSLLVSGSIILTGSLNVNGGITGSLLGTASYASISVTASYVNPLNQVVRVTGSIDITGSLTSSADITINGARIGHGNNNDTSSFLFGTGLSGPSGSFNIGIGENVLDSLTSPASTDNIAIGKSTLRYIGGGYSNSNIAIGTEALMYSSYAANSIAIGYQALNSGSGFGPSDAIAIGAYTGFGSRGNKNIFVGTTAGFKNTTGTDNVHIGYQAGYYNSSGVCNTSLGSIAYNQDSGSYNVSIGFQAGGWGDYASNYNVMIGERAGSWIGRYGPSNNNTTIGRLAGSTLASGSNNTVIGALASVDGNSDNNTVIGANVTIGSNVNNTIAIGDGEGNIRYYVNSSGNTAIGKTGPINAKLDVLGNVVITGSLNITGSIIATNGITGSLSGTASYADSASYLITPNNNVKIGNFAGDSLSSGYYNVLIGLGAGQNVTGGGDNVFIGRGSGDTVTTGIYSVAIGLNSGKLDGEENVSIGNNSGGGNGSPTYYARRNVSLGSYAGSNLGITGTSEKNTLIGYYAANGLSSGSNNTVIGNDAGSGLYQNYNNTIIGANVDPGNVNNTIAIGDGAGNIRYYVDSSGNTAIGKTSSINAKLDVSGSVIITGSLNVTQGITGSLLGTASYAITSSYGLSSSFSSTSSYINPLTQDVYITGSLNVTGSQSFKGNQTLQGWLRLTSSIDPNTATGNYIFASKSMFHPGDDLWIRHHGQSTNWDWVQGVLETGLLYGGIVTWSGNTVYVSSGSGIIVQHNATTGSEIDPDVLYVKWGNLSQAITGISTRQVTYLYIDENGALNQQAIPFTQQEYHTKIPLGAVGHFDYANISAFAENVSTAYSQIEQTNTFIDAFGPLKLQGYSITPQSGSLKISVSSGTTFGHGAFYSLDPENPSVYNTSAVVTASMVRMYRSGSGVYFDTNGGNLYTDIDPTKYDDGSGIPQSVGGNFSIQRVFSYPVNNTLYVYYGQTLYNTLPEAIQSVSTDPFVENDATAQFTTFIGYIITKGNTSDLTSNLNARIIGSGLFRNTAGAGAGSSVTITKLDDLSDVTITTPTDGQALVYSGATWINGNPVTSSYSLKAESLLDGININVNQITASNVIVNGPLYVSGSAITASILSNPYGDLILESSGSGIKSGSVEIHGGLKWKRTPTAAATEIGDLITFGATLGAIDGGELTTASAGGLVVQAAEMVAYTMTTFPYNQHNLTKFDTYGTSAASRQLTLPQTSSNYVYYNNSGVLTYGATVPSSRSNIILGKVVTDATSVIYIDAAQINAHHYSNYLDRMLREALGPIFYTGGIVTRGTVSGSLNVTAATYYFSETRITTVGASPVTLHTFYRGATSGQFVRTTGVATVSTSSYDNNTNSLTSIPSGKYVKHSLYLLGDNSLQATANEEYLMVYGQTLYDTIGDAVAGTLPTPPEYFTDQIVVIASIVVTPDSSSIQEIIDERPRLGFISPSKTGVITAHGDLTGLSNDDHPQYLLTNGSRTLTGNMNIGNYNISNVNTLTATSVTSSLFGTSSWATNASTASYIAQTGYLYSLSTSSQAITAGNTWQELNFERNQDIDGWSHTLGTGKFSSSLSGYYNIQVITSVQKTTSANASAATRLLYNGIEVTGSYSSFTFVSNNVPQEIISTATLYIPSGSGIKTEVAGTSNIVSVIPGVSVASPVVRPSAKIFIRKV